MRPACRKRVLNSPASDSPILHVLTHRTRADTGSTRAKDGCPNSLNAFGIHSHPNIAACLAIDWMIDRIESNERTQIGGAANSGTFFALPLVFRACPKDGGRHVRRNYRLIVICNEWNVILFPICFPDALRACIRYRYGTDGWCFVFVKHALPSWFKIDATRRIRGDGLQSSKGP